MNAKVTSSPADANVRVAMKSCPRAPAKAPLVPDPGHIFFRDPQFSMAKRS